MIKKKQIIFISVLYELSASNMLKLELRSL
jgi:hypothetical protein